MNWSQGSGIVQGTHRFQEGTDFRDKNPLATSHCRRALGQTAVKVKNPLEEAKFNAGSTHHRVGITIYTSSKHVQTNGLFTGPGLQVV